MFIIVNEVLLNIKLSGRYTLHTKHILNILFKVKNNIKQKKISKHI